MHTALLFLFYCCNITSSYELLLFIYLYFQCCFTDTGTDTISYCRVPKRQWPNLEGYGYNRPCIIVAKCDLSLRRRHNGRDTDSNHQPPDCFLNRLFRRRSKKTSKLHVTGLCAGGIHRRPVNSPHKWPVTRKMFPFDGVIMRSRWNSISFFNSFVS